VGRSKEHAPALGRCPPRKLQTLRHKRQRWRAAWHIPAQQERQAPEKVVAPNAPVQEALRVLEEFGPQHANPCWPPRPPKPALMPSNELWERICCQRWQAATAPPPNSQARASLSDHRSSGCACGSSKPRWPAAWRRGRVLVQVPAPAGRGPTAGLIEARALRQLAPPNGACSIVPRRSIWPGRECRWGPPRQGDLPPAIAGAARPRPDPDRGAAPTPGAAQGAVADGCDFTSGWGPVHATPTKPGVSRWALA